MATAANETDQKKIKALGTTASKAVDDMAAKLKALDDPAFDNGKTGEKLKQLNTAVTAYVKQAKNVIDMADGDSGTALTLMMGATRTFTTIENLTDDLTDSSKMLRDLKIALHNHDLEKQGMLLLAIMLFAVTIGCVASFLISGGISKPLSKIASVLRELTNDRIVDVPYTDRGDEVGEIAKATEVFKESVAEKVDQSARAQGARRGQLKRDGGR